MLKNSATLPQPGVPLRWSCTAPWELLTGSSGAADEAPPAIPFESASGIKMPAGIPGLEPVNQAF